jgi:hypothetical protein
VLPNSIDLTPFIGTIQTWALWMTLKTLYMMIITVNLKISSEQRIKHNISTCSWKNFYCCLKSQLHISNLEMSNEIRQTISGYTRYKTCPVSLIYWSN